jgi:hypothetical protein
MPLKAMETNTCSGILYRNMSRAGPPLMQALANGV